MASTSSDLNNLQVSMTFPIVLQAKITTTLTQVLQLYRAGYFTCTSYVLVLAALLYLFINGIIFYMLDDIYGDHVLCNYKNNRLLDNVCCLNLYAWNSEVYICK